MKVFLSVDMEGITGVAVPSHVSPDHAEYGRFRKLMTADANAAIAGAFDGGATEALVVDSHGPMTNLLIEELDPRARLMSGSNKYLCQMEGVSADFDAVFFVGYHGREGGSDAVLNHTLLGRSVHEIRCNGRPVSEAILNAGLAGHFGVPCALVTGDDLVCAETAEVLGPIETAVVKRAVDRVTAECLPPERAHGLIRTAAERAVRRARELRPYRVEPPVAFEVDFKGTAEAHMAAVLPAVERLGPKTIRVTGGDYLEAFRWLWGALILGRASASGVI